MARTLIRGGTLLTADEARPVVDDGYLVIDDDTIVEVGTGDPAVRRADEVLDAAGMLVTPGSSTRTRICA